MLFIHIILNRHNPRTPLVVKAAAAVTPENPFIIPFCQRQGNMIQTTQVASQMSPNAPLSNRSVTALHNKSTKQKANEEQKKD